VTQLSTALDSEFQTAGAEQRKARLATGIDKGCSENLVRKGVNFEAQSALKLTSTFNFRKNSRGYTPRPPLKGGGEGKEREGAREGSRPFTFLVTPLLLA